MQKQDTIPRFTKQSSPETRPDNTFILSFRTPEIPLHFMWIASCGRACYENISTVKQIKSRFSLRLFYWMSICGFNSRKMYDISNSIWASFLARWRIFPSLNLHHSWSPTEGNPLRMFPLAYPSLTQLRSFQVMTAIAGFTIFPLDVSYYITNVPLLKEIWGVSSSQAL